MKYIYFHFTRWNNGQIHDKKQTNILSIVGRHNFGKQIQNIGLNTRNSYVAMTGIKPMLITFSIVVGVKQEELIIYFIFNWWTKAWNFPDNVWD